MQRLFRAQATCSILSKVEMLEEHSVTAVTGLSMGPDSMLYQGAGSSKGIVKQTTMTAQSGWEARKASGRFFLSSALDGQKTAVGTRVEDTMLIM